MTSFIYLYCSLIAISLMFSISSARDQMQKSMSQSSFASAHEETLKSQQFASSNMNMGNQVINQPPLGQACPVGQICNANGQIPQHFHHDDHSQKSAHFQNFQQSTTSHGNSFEIPITCSCCESRLFLSVRSTCNAQGNHFQNFAASNIGGNHRSQETAYDSASFSAGGEYHEVSSKQHRANHNGNTHGFDAHRANHNGDITGSATLHQNGQSATFNGAQFNAIPNCPQGNCFNAPPVQQLNGMQNSNFLAAEAHKSQFKESSSHYSDNMLRSLSGGAAHMTDMNMNSKNLSMIEHESRAASQMNLKTQNAHQMGAMNNSNSFHAQSHDMSQIKSRSASQIDAHGAPLQQPIANQAACPNCNGVNNAVAFANAQAASSGNRASAVAGSGVNMI